MNTLYISESNELMTVKKQQHIFVVSNYYDEFEFDSIERASRNKINEK